jgi:hypothetical protein
MHDLETAFLPAAACGILPVYDAGEHPIDGATSQDLVHHLERHQPCHMVDSVTRESDSTQRGSWIHHCRINTAFPAADLRTWMHEENTMNHLENCYNPKKDHTKARAAVWYCYTKMKPNIQNIPQGPFQYMVEQYL